MNNTLVYGPWIGEFGWELFCAQGVLRELSKKYKNVIVATSLKNKLLYEDITSDFVIFEHDKEFACQWNDNPIMKDKSKLFKSPEYLKIFDKYLDTTTYDRILPGTPLIRISNSDSFWNNAGFGFKQSFVSYGKVDQTLSYDTVLHMRYRSLNDPSRNWPIEKWESLVKLLLDAKLKVACIGGPLDHYVDGIDDFRKCGLNKEADLLKSSKITVGSISGGTHFSTLCECKQVMWGAPRYKKRVISHWNPFNVNISYLEEPNPSVETVFKNIKQLL